MKSLRWVMFLVVGVGVVGVSGGVGGQVPSASEAAMVKAVDAQTAGDVALDQLVDINSGTMNLAGVVRVKDVVGLEVPR